MDNQKIPRLMNRSNRATIIGPTGSGKTIAGLYQVARRPLNKEPWIILNFKGDAIIDSIAKAKHIDLDHNTSSMEKGIYIVHPRPDEISRLDDFLWSVWESERIGVFVDEGFMLAKSPAYEAILTQGRSKQIPVITCTQRPSWISRFAFSEAEFIQLFPLRDDRDTALAESFMPRLPKIELSDYFSWYYDVAKRNLFLFRPVPNSSEILKIIDSKLFTRKI